MNSMFISFLSAWWLLEYNFDRICESLIQAFGTVILRERQSTKLRVEVSAAEPSGSTSANQPPVMRKLSTLFGFIESRKEQLCIQEYSISQTSLEQIFNQFAAQQEEETGAAGGIVQVQTTAVANDVPSYAV